MPICMSIALNVYLCYKRPALPQNDPAQLSTRPHTSFFQSLEAQNLGKMAEDVLRAFDSSIVPFILFGHVCCSFTGQAAVAQLCVSVYQCLIILFQARSASTSSFRSVSQVNPD